MMFEFHAQPLTSIWTQGRRPQSVGGLSMQLLVGPEAFPLPFFSQQVLTAEAPSDQQGSGMPNGTRVKTR